MSILTCIVRCACFGVSCCCSCFHCLKCCGNCCGCCDPPGGKPHKYLDEPYNPPQQNGYGYRQEAPMQASFPPPAPASYAAAGPPQYAEFDSKKKGAEDSLPVMPSWEGSSSRKVMLEEESVEMDDLKKKAPSPDQHMHSMAGAPSDRMAPMPRAANNPYGNSQAGSSGYMTPRGQQPANPYSGQEQGYDYNANRLSDGYGLDQPYDAPAPVALAAAPRGRQSPAPRYNGYGQPQVGQGYGQMQAGTHELDAGNSYGHSAQGYGMRSPGDNGTRSPAPYGMDPRMRNSPGPSDNGTRSPAPYGMDPRMRNSPGPGDNYNGTRSPAPYGMDPRMRNSPGPGQSQGVRRGTPGPRNDFPQAESARGSPAPQNDYGFAPPRHHTPKPVPYRSYSPAIERQQTPVTVPAPQSPKSPITNNAGFDFTSGYSRPQTQDANHDRRPSESQEPEGKEAYPGYKPYQPAQQAWSGV